MFAVQAALRFALESRIRPRARGRDFLDHRARHRFTPGGRITARATFASPGFVRSAARSSLRLTGVTINAVMPGKHHHGGGLTSDLGEEYEQNHGSASIPLKRAG